MNKTQKALYSPRAFYQVLSGSPLAGGKLERVVHRRLQSVLVSAYRHVPYHREQMRSVGYDPTRDYRGPEDLTRLPITSRQVLKQLGVQPFIHEGADLARCHKDSTSGSTGVPLVVYRGHYERSVQVAKWFRVLLANGYSIRDRVMSLTSPMRLGSGSSPLQRLGLFRRLAVDYRLSPADMVDRFLSYRPDVLYGNRSHLELMALELKSRGIRHSGLKLLVATGMAIDEGFRHLWRTHGSIEPVDSYGSVELGAMAYETPERDGLHLTQDLVHFEFLDDQGGQARPGQRARILVTDLASRVMPWIRYETEDAVEYGWQNSSQGVPERRLTKIHGRESDLLLLPDGSKRAYQTLATPLKSHPQVLQYQIVQSARDLVRILLVMDAAEFDKAVSILQQKLSQELPASMRIEFLSVDRIEPDASGKRKLLVSEVEE